MVSKKTQLPAPSLLRAPKMKKTAGTARARSPAMIDGFSQPGRKLAVTPIEANVIPGTTGASRRRKCSRRTWTVPGLGYKKSVWSSENSS